MNIFVSTEAKKRKLFQKIENTLFVFWFDQNTALMIYSALKILTWKTDFRVLETRLPVLKDIA